MAADANAIALSDYAILSNDPRVLRITKSLLENGAVLVDIPLVTKKTLVANGVRWQDNLPTVNWGKLSGGLTVTKGKPTAYQEQIYLVRNGIDTDIKLLEEENRIVDPRAAMLQGYLAGLSYDFNDKFINNDHLSGSADSLVGLRARLDNPSVYGVQSEMKIDAGGVDLSTGGMTAATANTFIEYIQQVLDYMGRPEGDGVVFYMNDLMKRRFEHAVRLMGAGAGWRMTTDAYDRAVTSYKNARIVDIGRKADQTTRIITYTETSAGANGASNYTSIYAVAYGEDRFIGWQWDTLGNSIEDIGLIGNDGTLSRVRIDWGIGVYPQHTRCISRLFNIKVS